MIFFVLMLSSADMEGEGRQRIWYAEILAVCKLELKMFALF